MDSHNPVMSGELTGESVRKESVPQSGLQRWKVAKNCYTSIVVIHRFGKTSSSKKFQLTIQGALEKRNVLERTSAKKQLAGYSLTSESPLSPQRFLAQDEGNQKVSTVLCLAHLVSLLKQYSSSVDPLVWSQFLLALFSLQFLPKDSLDEFTAGMVIFTVVVVVLTSRMEGTAATELVRLIIQIASKSPLLWLFMLVGGLVTGSSAESPVQTSVASKDASNTLKMPFDIKTAAITICLGCIIIAVARKILAYLTRPEPVPVMDDRFDIMGGLDRTDNRRSNLTLNIRPKI